MQHYCINYCQPNQSTQYNNRQENTTHQQNSHQNSQSNHNHHEQHQQNNQESNTENKGGESLNDSVTKEDLTNTTPTNPKRLNSPYFGLLVGYERWITPRYALGLETVLNMPHDIAEYNHYTLKQWSIPLKLTHRYQFDNGFSLFAKYGVSFDQVYASGAKNQHVSQLIATGGGYSINQFSVNLEYNYIINPVTVKNLTPARNQINLGIVYSVPF
jgi:hypothetical protein